MHIKVRLKSWTPVVIGPVFYWSGISILEWFEIPWNKKAWSKTDCSN